MAEIISFGNLKVSVIARLKELLDKREYVRLIHLGFDSFYACREDEKSQIYLMIANAYSMLKEYRSGVEALNMSLQCDPDNKDALCMMIQLLICMGDYIGSKEYYFILSKKDTTKEYIKIVNKYIFRTEEKITVDDEIRLIPESETIARLLEECNVIANNSGYNEAVKHYILLAEKYPKEIKVLNNVAFASLFAEDYSGAIKYARKILEIDRSNLNAYCVLFITACAGEKTDDIKKYSRKILKLPLNTIDEFIKVCALFEDGGLTNEFNVLFAVNNEKYGNNYAYLLAKSIMKYRSGEKKEGIELLEKCISLYPFNEIAKFYMRCFIEGKEGLYRISNIDNPPEELAREAVNELLFALEKYHTKDEFSKNFMKGRRMRENFEIAVVIEELRVIEMVFDRLTTKLVNENIEYFLDIVNKMLSVSNKAKARIIYGLLSKGYNDNLEVYSNNMLHKSKIINCTDLNCYPPIYTKAYNLAFSIALFNDKEFESSLYDSLKDLLLNQAENKYNFKDFNALASLIYYNSYLHMSDSVEKDLCEMFDCEEKLFYKYLKILRDSGDFADLEGEDVLNKQIQALISKFGNLESYDNLDE